MIFSSSWIAGLQPLLGEFSIILRPSHRFSDQSRPIDAVTSVFNATGIQGVLQSTPDGPLLVGYFPCDKPPSVGFSFPSASNAAAAGNDSTSSVSKKSSIFNIPTNQWIAADNGNNNCTSVLSGSNVPNVTGLWVIGQGKPHSLAPLLHQRRTDLQLSLLPGSVY